MPINMRQQTLEYFGTQALNQLSTDPMLQDMVNNAITYIEGTGAYKVGAQVNIDITVGGTSSTKTDFTTNNPITFGKGEFNRSTLNLTNLIFDNIKFDQLDRVFSSAGSNANGPAQALIRQKVIDIKNTIEKRNFLETFNVDTIDGNVLGADGTEFGWDDLNELDQKFSERDWDGTIYLVLEAKRFKELRANYKDAFKTIQTGDITNATMLRPKDFPNILIRRNNKLPTATELNQLTTTGTNKVNFAFASDSVAMLNPVLPVPETQSANIFNVPENGLNIQFSSTVDTTKEIIEELNVMRFLFGTVIYRPSVVFPILGGGIT